MSLKKIISNNFISDYYDLLFWYKKNEFIEGNEECRGGKEIQVDIEKNMLEMKQQSQYLNDTSMSFEDNIICRSANYRACAYLYWNYQGQNYISFLNSFIF
jgi:hypothetical protein